MSFFYFSRPGLCFVLFAPVINMRPHVHLQMQFEEHKELIRDAAELHVIAPVVMKDTNRSV